MPYLSVNLSAGEAFRFTGFFIRLRKHEAMTALRILKKWELIKRQVK